MRTNQIVRWHGFRGRIEKIYPNEVRIRITTTWAPYVPKDEIETKKGNDKDER